MNWQSIQRRIPARLTLTVGGSLLMLCAQNLPVDPVRFLATLEFDGQDFFDSGEQVFPVAFHFNTHQDANGDGVVSVEDNLENIVRFAIGDSIVGTGKTGLPQRGPNDQRPAVYFHYLDLGLWKVYQYWLYYPDNDWMNDHEHDWEFYFVYVIRGVPVTLGYSWHGWIQMVPWCQVPMDQGHPRLGVDGGSHAFKTSSEDGVRIRWTGFVERRNGQLNLDTATIGWVIYSNDPGVAGGIPFPMTVDTFYYGDPFYGTGEWSDARLAPWLRTRWVLPELPSDTPLYVDLPDTLWICPGDSFLIDASVPGATLYVWNTGDSTSQLSGSDTGVYVVWVYSSVGGCTYAIPETVVVQYYPYPVDLRFPVDSILLRCPGETLTISILDTGRFSWAVWNYTDTGWVFQPDTPGSIVLEVQDTLGCLWRDTFILQDTVLSIQIYPLDPDSLCFRGTVIGADTTFWYLQIPDSPDEWTASGDSICIDTIAGSGNVRVCLVASGYCGMDSVCVDRLLQGVPGNWISSVFQNSHICMKGWEVHDLYHFLPEQGGSRYRECFLVGTDGRIFPFPETYMLFTGFSESRYWLRQGFRFLLCPCSESSSSP